MNKNKGYTLVELMITITIVGVIASFAIPAYQDYVTRSQVAESFALFDGKRVQAEDFLHLNGDNNKNFQNTLPINSKYIEMAIEKYSDAYYDIAFLYGSESNKPLQGKSILFFNELSSKDNILWECQTDIEQKYLPGNLQCETKTFNNNSSCNATTLPDIESMPDIDGLEKKYDPERDIYTYIKKIDDDSYFYTFYGIVNYKNTKLGHDIYYDPYVNNIREISYKDDKGSYFINKGLFQIYYEPYSKYNDSIFNYINALELINKYGNPATTTIPIYDKEEYDNALSGINSGELKNNANQFFRQFENDYINPQTNEISSNAPKMLKDLYLNLDPDTMKLKDNQFSQSLFDINEYPNLANNLHELINLHQMGNLKSTFCNNDPNSSK